MKPRDKKIRVLVIDEEAETPRLLENTFHFETARTLESGLRLIARKNADVILLGETFLEISHTVSDIPVVILTPSPNGHAAREQAQDSLYKKEASPEVWARTLRFAVERHALRRELASANARLERLSLTDPVTELFNRRGFQEILSHELQRARRQHSELLVLLIDLDDFKKINNALGHSAGDIVLREVALKLKKSLRATDYVARVGGDEFMVLLPETRFAEGMRVAEKIRMAISTTIVSMSRIHDVQITASLGLINANMLPFSDSTDPLGDMMSKIHLLLHHKKKSAKNRVSYDEEQIYYESISEVPELLADGSRFYAMMQPIYRLSDRVQTGCEFLSRSTIKGFEMPDDFFRAALEANLLAKVDYQCLKTCVEASADLPEGSRCHLNIFPSTLLHLPPGNFLELFQGSPRRRVAYCIEISEQQIIGDPSYLMEPVAAMKKAGVSIAIDDLGFGRSCLESLILLEPDIVKIDKKCVTGIAGDEAPTRSLKRLIKMARSLGAEVIAEGIETQQDLDLLRDLGGKWGQGYFLGKPQFMVKKILSPQ